MNNIPNLLIEQIDAILPQTQCRQCGFEGCKPYAAAIAQGEANINQCPPGGQEGIRALAELTGMPYVALNTAHGVYKPKALAVIDEQVCIGCTLCLQACPVDAILGAQKYMHTVIATECTGCELCIAPCPVDCISMTPIHGDLASNPVHIKQAADIARGRYEFRVARIARDQSIRAEQYAARRISPNTAAKQTDVHSTPLNTDLPRAHDKKAAIAAAMARAAALKSIPK